MKTRLVFVTFLVLGALAFAQGIDLGDFPLGTWLDAKYTAYWEITSDNIQITDGAGTIYYNFSQKTVENFKVTAETAGIVLSFSCVESGKKYRLTKPLTSFDLILDIDPAWKVHYKTTMKMQ